MMMPFLLLAFETGGMRSLQTGPVGEGLAFVQVPEAETELALRVRQTDGTEKSGDDRLHATRQTRETRLGAGFGYGKVAHFTVEGAARQTEYDASTRKAAVEEHGESTTTELTAGPAVWLGRVMLGARSGVVALGRETRTLTTDGDEAEATLAPVTIPLLKLYSGYRGDGFTAMARLKLYNDANATASYKDDVGGDSRDVKRASPGEATFDVTAFAFPQLQLGLDYTYVAAGQDGESGAVDYMRLGAGGQFHAAPWVALAGSYHYTEPSFKNERAASLYSENLGGSRLDVGAHYLVEALRASFDVGYQVPHRVDYANRNGDPAWKGDAARTKVEQAVWDVSTGVTYHW